MTRGLGILFAVAATLGVHAGLAQSQIKADEHNRNASFLSRRFLTDSKNAASLADDFLAKTAKFYKTPFLFPNGGLLSSRGVLDHAPGAANIFLDRVAAFESEHHVSLTLMPYLNGYSLQDTAHRANLRLDLGKPEVRKSIVRECGRYVSAKAPGSYVKGSHRAFDGIMLDIEPGGDPGFLRSLKLLLAEIRASFDRIGLNNKKIAFAAPQLSRKTPKPHWAWDSSDYHYMARYLDYIVAMTYDSGLKKPEYGSWIDDQTTQILRAVSGSAWGSDAAHPRPKNGVKVFIGLPGFYARTRAHDPEIETVAQGAPGVLRALSQLSAGDRSSSRCFEGAAMFSHDGGAADSAYARYDKDWLSWLQHWLESEAISK
jgi:hypothetical protein